MHCSRLLVVSGDDHTRKKKQKMLPSPSGAFHYDSYSSGGVPASVLAPTGV